MRSHDRSFWLSQQHPKHAMELSQAKDVEQVVKIQTDFISQQLNYFNEQAKIIFEMCTKTAQDMTRRSS